jgi:putative spermidine/putrescine transport system permease protein
MRDLKRSRRMNKLRAFGLVLPLAVFLLLVFLSPIAILLSRSVSEPAVGPVLPLTIEALRGWDGTSPPPDEAYEALIKDLRNVPSAQILAQAAARLNYSVPGMRSLLASTRSKLEKAESGNARDILLGISEKWGEVEPWAAIWQARGPYTDYYLLASLDLRRDATGAIVGAPESERVFIPAIVRTFEISIGVTVLTLLIGFPFAYLASTLSAGWARIMMFVVLLPFWTAVMVRTLSWAVLLQKEGIINQALWSLGLISEPVPLMFSRFAVYIGLVHIFLPYMVLPLYSVMCTVPGSYMRAAASLGATPFTAFRRVYLPQVGPGIAAGCTLVFIQCLGVFVIPAILGGPDDQGIPFFVAFYVNRTLNWGLAASLSIILLACVLIFYWLFRRLSGDTSFRLG